MEQQLTPLAKAIQKVTERRRLFPNDNVIAMELLLVINDLLVLLPDERALAEKMTNEGFTLGSQYTEDVVKNRDPDFILLSDVFDKFYTQVNPQSKQ